MRTMSALVGLVSRVPARVQVKLLAAFLAIEVLLIVVGAVGTDKMVAGAINEIGLHPGEPTTVLDRWPWYARWLSFIPSRD